jgi:GDP-L-fucose synthase
LDKEARIYVAGGSTLIGAALLSQLTDDGSGSVIGGVGEPDLTDACAVDEYFAAHAPEYVFLAAGRSGGIAANQRYPAELIRDNLLVECNVIHSAYRHGVRKLVYLASSCSYPRLAPQPILEAALLTGPLEPTNEAYAVAKIAGIKLCQAYRQQYGVHFVAAIPANAFGPGDDFSLEESHVIAALIRKMHEAKTRGRAEVEVWGSGTPRREFIFVRDLADACLWVMNRYDGIEPINLGAGVDVSIRELAEAVRETVGYTGRLRFDASKPDGMPRKALDSSKLYGLGWRPQAGFQDALAETYAWFLQCECEKELTHA